MGTKKYPHAIFVHREQDPSDRLVSWLVAEETAEASAEIGEVVEVAEYQFVGMRKIKTTTEVS